MEKLESIVHKLPSDMPSRSCQHGELGCLRKPGEEKRLVSLGRDAARPPPPKASRLVVLAIAQQSKPSLTCADTSANSCGMQKLECGSGTACPLSSPPGGGGGGVLNHKSLRVQWKLIVVIIPFPLSLFLLFLSLSLSLSLSHNNIRFWDEMENILTKQSCVCMYINVYALSLSLSLSGLI